MSKLIQLLIAETGLVESDLLKIIRTAPNRYKVFEIPKRSGGMREIAQPSREVKLLQRILISRLLDSLPVHDAAHAYRKGLSIADNARPHSGAGPILKMDFQNFFPSIRSSDWDAYCLENGILDPADRPISSQILFRRAKGEHLLKLSVGAPSSPALSNVLLYPFDEIVMGEANRRGINFTRYADDLTFSGQRIGMLKDMVKVVEGAVRQLAWPRLTVNAQKTRFITASKRRTVTGITLTNDGALSLGRDRKRLISAQVHYGMLGKLSPEELGVLAGQLAFVNVVEPNFLVRLRNRYGDEIITKIRNSRLR